MKHKPVSYEQFVTALRDELATSHPRAMAEGEEFGEGKGLSSEVLAIEGECVLLLEERQSEQTRKMLGVGGGLALIRMLFTLFLTHPDLIPLLVTLFTKKAT